MKDNKMEEKDKSIHSFTSCPAQVRQGYLVHHQRRDVTKFLKEHPGGEEVLVEYAGKDATKGFEAVGHSKEAYNLFLKFQVGYLQGYIISQLDRYANKELAKEKEMEAFVIKDDLNPKHSILVEFLVLALVIAFYFGYGFVIGAVHFAS